MNRHQKEAQIVNKYFKSVQYLYPLGENKLKLL